MSIKVRYFANLKESVGRSEDDLTLTGLLTVHEVWNHANRTNHYRQHSGSREHGLR